MTLAERYFKLPPCTASISELLAQTARRTPDAPFLEVEHVASTFGEFHQRSDRLAAGLLSLGIQTGDRVAFLSMSRLAMAELIFAVWRAGAIVVPLNIHLQGSSLHHQIEDSGAETIVIDHAGSESLEGILNDLPDVKRCIHLEGDSFEHGCKSVTASALLEDEPCSTGFPSPTDVAALMYTSGTTGLPKACILSHRYMYHVGRSTVALFDVTNADRFHGVAPLYHLNAYNPIIAGVICGSSTVIDNKYSASGYIDRLRQTRATLAVGVGFYASAALAQPEQESDTDNVLRSMILAPLSEEDRERFEQRFGVQLITEAYGQTESSMAAVNPHDEHREPGSAGSPSPWLDVVLLDDDDNPVAPGEIGEIAFRPRVPGVMFDGYWNNPDATVESFRSLWHHTRDLARMTPSGSLLFVDRKSDNMRRRGENISSFQLEQTLVAHPKIAEAAVHTVWLDGDLDVEIKACIVQVDSESLQPRELADYLAQHVPYYAIPRFVELMEALPRNVNGRILKFQLRQRPTSAFDWDLHDLGVLPSRAPRK